ncbi:hypothetical protein [Streptomyces goshikiensis]|uniref:hypothetical protein n=1 Tax=Streptomyces goshikiensis TaxID=1942 RepID=UPI003657BD4B
MSAISRRKTLIIGASRGLGLVLANELVRRGWQVIATTRQGGGELQANAAATARSAPTARQSTTHINQRSDDPKETA